MSELEQLYNALSLGQNVDAITKHLMSIYENPQSIFALLELIDKHTNEFIRHHAAIGLNSAFRFCWNNIYQSQAEQPIKEMLLSILSKEPSIQIRLNVIHAMSHIVKYQNTVWQLDGFITKLIETQQPIQIETAIRLLYISVEHFNFDQFVSYSALIGQQILAAISSDLPSLNIAGYELFSQIISFFKDPLEAPFSDILQRCVTSLHQLTVQSDPLAYKMSNIVEHLILSNNGSINDAQLLNILLQMSIDPHITHDFIFCIFSPIQGIVMKEDSIYIMKPIISDFFKSLIFNIARCSSDDCYTESSDASLIAETISLLCEYMNADKIYNLAVSLLSENTPDEIFASAVVLNKLIENSPAQAMTNSSFLSKTLIKYIGPQMHHSIREAALMALESLIPCVESGMNDFFDPIIQGCVFGLDPNHAQLLNNSLQTMSIALDCLDFQPKYLEILIPKLMPFTQLSFEVASLVIRPLSALVVACGSDIIPYIPTIMPFIVQAAQVNETAYPILKGEAIEALAKLIAVAPQHTQSIIGAAMQLFNECTNTSDTSIISSLLAGFSVLVSAHFDGIESFVGNALKYAINQLDCQQQQSVIYSEGFDPEENQDINMDICASLQHAMTVIENVALSHPEVLMPMVEEVSGKLTNLANWPSDLINQKAISALAAIIISYRIDPNGIIKDLSDVIIDGPQEIPVAALFDLYRTIMEKDIPINPQNLGEIFNNGMKGIEHKLPCIDYSSANKGGDDDDDEDMDDDGGYASIKLDLMQSIFKCLSIFAAKYTSSFNITKFTQTCDRAMKKNNIVEVIEATSVLGRLFEANKASFSGLTLKFALRTITDSLNFCDGTYMPNPIIAIRRIITTDPSAFAQNVPQLIEKAAAALNLVNDGQPYYRQTISAADSLLFAILQLQGAQFPIQMLLPPMLAALPTKYESEYIYGSLVALYGQAKEIFAPFTAELVRGLAMTLCLKEDELKKFNLSQGTISGIVAVFAATLQAIPNNQEFIRSVITDSNSLERLQACLASV